MTNEIWPRVNEELCRAWGLNPSEVTSIMVSFRPRELPQAIIRVTINEESMQLIMKLVPKGEHNDR